MGKACVTGSSGYIASHVVAQLLKKGHTVHGTVRDSSNSEKTAHLMALPGAADRLKLFSADLQVPGGFVAPIAGCDAVFHIATPLSAGGQGGEEGIFKPAMAGLKQVMDAVDQAGTVTTFVLTSSMSAMAPRPEPSIKSEEHWSDPESQKARDSWYGAAKTTQERTCQAWAESKPNMRYVAICPTMVVGPMLQPTVNATMNMLASVVNGTRGMTKAMNDSMSYVDVRDCAAIHVAGYEQQSASGRYMCLVESLHWNDIVKILVDLHPSMPPVAPCDGVPVRPTQFNRSKQDSLGIQVRGIPTLMAEAIEDLKRVGAVQ